MDNISGVMRYRQALTNSLELLNISFASTKKQSIVINTISNKVLLMLSKIQIFHVLTCEH